jgi:hypothetical protein
MHSIHLNFAPSLLHITCIKYKKVFTINNFTQYFIICIFTLTDKGVLQSSLYVIKFGVDVFKLRTILQNFKCIFSITHQMPMNCAWFVH